MIYLFCALPCEAKPLLHYYSMTPYQKLRTHPTYINPPLCLSVTGCGMQRMHQAVQSIQQHFSSSKYAAWINIGIAGHASLAVGQLLLAQRIINTENNSVWYPQRTFKTTLRSIDLKTVNTPEQYYPDNCLYDMESAGFYAAAISNGLYELIHCLKVVSDNAHHDITQISSSKVTELIEKNLADLTTVIDTLGALSQTQIKLQQLPKSYNVCLQTWHFSQYQQQVLADALRRYQLLCPEQNIMCELAGHTNAKTVLQTLAKILQRQSFYLQ